MSSKQAIFDKIDDALDADSPRPRFVVTPDTLTALWDEHPHARWYFEVEAEASRVDIEVRA